MKSDEMPEKDKVLMASGFLTDYALLTSMKQSKLLTTMVLVGLIGFSALFYFLFS